jgi:hypothetical protein
MEEVILFYILKEFEHLFVVVIWRVVENLSKRGAAAIKCGSKTLFRAKYANRAIAGGGDKE